MLQTCHVGEETRTCTPLETPGVPGGGRLSPLPRPGMNGPRPLPQGSTPLNTSVLCQMPGQQRHLRQHDTSHECFLRQLLMLHVRTDCNPHVLK